MKKLFNSSSVLIGLILVLIGVLANRKAINGTTEKAIASVLFKNNYAQQWQIKPGSIHDGDTLRVVRGSDEYKQYSGNCESAENLGWAEKIARDDKLGVWNGSHEKPWDWRKSHK
jgi:endonuclease YncB( thermonuclease family)